MNAVTSYSIYRHCSVLFVVLSLCSWPTTLRAQSDATDADFQKIELRGLSGINTTDLEYAPTVTADGHTIYFVSDRPGGRGGHDMWTGSIRDRRDTVVSSVRNLGNSFNTSLNEGTASISADGQTMYFVGCNRSDGVGDCDIYEARLEGDSWRVVRNLKEINSPDWDSQPSISSDGRNLYFVSTRPGAKGGDGDIDIYVATRLATGKWSKPKNLGSPINTSRREDSPFILPGGEVLYFSSARAGGYGGLDFYVSRRNSDGSWGSPENLGMPINTFRDERFITLPAAGDVVYFASERRDIQKGGTLDIFVGMLPPRVVTVLINGRVFDRATNVSLPADLIFVDAESGETLYGTPTDAAGEYALVINPEKTSTVEVYGIANGYGPIRSTIHIPETKSYMEIREDFPLNAKVAVSEEMHAATGIDQAALQGSSTANEVAPVIRALPNPAADRIALEISAELQATGGNEVVVFDAYGNQVLSQSITGTRLVLDLQELPNGVYLARIGQAATAFVVRR